MVLSPLWLFAITLLLALSQGCSGIRHATSAKKIEVTYGVMQVHQATLATFKEMHIAVAKEFADDYKGRVDGRWQDGTSASVIYSRVEGDMTEISVLAGKFGDKVRHQDIIDKIKEKLK